MSNESIFVGEHDIQTIRVIDLWRSKIAIATVISQNIIRKSDRDVGKWILAI